MKVLTVEEVLFKDMVDQKIDYEDVLRYLEFENVRNSEGYMFHVSELFSILTGRNPTHESFNKAIKNLYCHKGVHSLKDFLINRLECQCYENFGKYCGFQKPYKLLSR